MVIQANDFKSRYELENYVRNQFGLTPEPKDNITIQGTISELAILHLSNDSIFWGIKCICIDKPEEPQSGKIERGNFNNNFGINKNE